MLEQTTEAELDVGTFLRSRRTRLDPAGYDLPGEPGSRRGLRRADVAALAGISAEAYDRLERGRDAVPAAVLEAVARALRLSPADRGVLCALARPALTTARPMRAQRIRPGVLRLLAGDDPALLLGNRLDVLAANPAALALHPGLADNLPRWLFGTAQARELYHDWPAMARETVGELHRYAARHPHDPQLAELAGDLSRTDATFRRRWTAEPEPRHPRGPRDLRHPVAGPLTLNQEALHPAGDLDQTLIVLHAEDGSPSQATLRLLTHPRDGGASGAVTAAPPGGDGGPVSP